MNKVYRVVRSKIDGRMIVASEIARGAVKGKGLTMVAMATLMLAGQAHAQVPPSTSVVAATGSGVTVNTEVVDSVTRTSVKIATPTAGISHNTFTTFNIGINSAVVLNNATAESSVSSWTSDPRAQLPNETNAQYKTFLETAAAKIGANSSLSSGSATTIINEVLSLGGSASSLAGTLEIAGQKANLIIANPYGITVNGANFLNAGDVTLATGSILNKTAGNVALQLTNSPLTIRSPSGVTSLSADGLALISRRVVLDGKIDANTIKVVAHDGQATVAASGGVTTDATGALGGTLAGYAIDTSALGGMYANTISLVATEAGVGVSVLGNMAALGDAISIDAAGDLTVGSSATSTSLEAGDITLKSGEALVLNKASLRGVARDAVAAVDAVVDNPDTPVIDETKPATKAITATTGVVKLEANSLSSTGSDSAKTTVSADGLVQVTVTTATTLANSALGAKKVDIDAATLTVAASALIGSTNADASATQVVDIATTGDITVDGELVLGAGTSAVTSSAGNLTLTDTSDVSGDNLTLSSAGAGNTTTLEAGAKLVAAGNLGLMGDTVTTNGNVSVAGNLTVGSDTSATTLGASNAGSLLSVGGNAEVRGATITVNSDMAVTGTTNLGGTSTTAAIVVDGDSAIASHGAVSISGASLVLDGDVLAKSGGLTASLVNNMTVAQTGSLIAGGTTPSLSVLAGGLLNNAGLIESAGTLTVGNGAVGSALTNTGTVQAKNDLAINVAGLAYNKASIASETAQGRALGKAYASGASASTSTFEKTLNVDETQLGLIKSTAGGVSITAANTINEADIEAATALNLSQTALRSQLAGIWKGTSNAGDDRLALMGTPSQYDYVSRAGVESFATDDMLSVGRANYAPGLVGSTITYGSSALNIGGTVSGTQTGTLTQVDVAPNRVVTTNVTPSAPPVGGSGSVAIDGTAPVVANGTTATTIEQASNNSTWVVQIAEPNAAGLSNNTYSLFNVNTNGLIFNNMPLGQSLTANTQLSAEIVGNPTLVKPASVVLNQVFSTSASKINGFMEVAGNSADVLIVNPYGIVCDSCGVINVDRLDFVVGDVGLANGLVTSLNSTGAASFSLLGGGLDATSASWMSIVAPQATIAGGLNANGFYMGLGAGSFARGDTTGSEYARTTTAAGTNTSALEVTYAGGVFADSITIDSKTTAAQASVRVYGEMSANQGDLLVDADGVVGINGRVSGSRDVTLKTTSNLDGKNVATADVQLLGGAVTSGRDMLVDAQGSLVFDGGQLYSFADVTLRGNTFIDQATANPSEFNNTRFAGGELNFEINGQMKFSGTAWEANIFRMGKSASPERRPTVEIGDGTVLKALSLMDIHASTVENSGTVASLDRSQIDASVSVTNLAAGVFTSALSSSLRVPTLSNYGNWIAAGSSSALPTTAIPVPVVWNVNNITNAVGGQIASTALWQIAPMSGAAGTSFVNKGGVASDVAMDASFSSLNNSGNFTASRAGSMTASNWTANTLTNTASGTLFAAGDLLVNADGMTDVTKRGASLSNSGVFQGEKNLTLAFNTLDLAAGKELAGALSGAGTFNLGVTNALGLDGLLYSKDDFIGSFSNNLTINPNGAVIASTDASITTTGHTLANYGFLYAGNNLTLAGANVGNFTTVSVNPTFTRLGVSATDGKTYYEGKQTLLSYGDMQAGNNIDIDATTAFVNSSEVRAIAGNVTVDAPLISNQVQRADVFDTSDPITRTVNKKINFTQDTVDVSCYSYPNDCDNLTRTSNWEEFDYYKDGTPDKSPQLLAGGVFELRGATVQNYGGLLQSTGTGSNTLAASTVFTNDALAKEKETWKWVQTGEVKYIALGPAKYSDSRWQGGAPSNPLSVAVPDPGKANVLTSGPLTISGEAVVNVGSFSAATAQVTPAGPASLNPGAFSLAITLPSSPNGFFVTNRDPSAKYLVEMNPKLQSGVSTLGSDYLLEALNVNGDITTRRLGDASYEAYMVEQQLLQATGSAVLDGYETIANVMQGFMDNAVAASSALGLEYGKPLTDAQLAALEEPIVWMIEVEIDGQIVLAPQVYLPKKLQEEIAEGGAVISASDIDMDVDTLDNLGGTIQAQGDLDIKSKGDINNISGQIKGNNVSVESTEGNINNETFSQYGGNDIVGQTTIGKTAGISAANDLSLKAAGDITNLGAEVNAGNNASIEAGGDVTFDTIEDVTRTRDVSGSASGMNSTITVTSTETVKQIKSGLNVGGNLETRSGGDTTFAGTDVNVGGNADVQSDGAINIIAREDREETSTETRSSSVGGGSLLSTTTTTTDTLSIRNVGSTFNVGGDASFDAKKDMTVQGSELNVGGDADIKADSLNVLAGRDLDQSSTKTETMSIGVSVEQIDNVDGSTSTGVTFGQGSVETEERLSQRSQASKLNIGGNLNVDVDKDVVLQGSEVEAGGNVDIEAENIRLLAAQNIERVEKSKTTMKFGLYASAEAEGEAGTETNLEAGAEAGTDSTSMAATANASAKAGASAGAKAEGTASATMDFAIGRTDTETALDITNTGSLIKSGGNLRLNAEKKIELEGSEVVAEGDVDVNATDIEARAAQDISVRSKSAESLRMGIYADAGGEAEAKASAGAEAEASGAAGVSATGTGAKASANAEAGAEAGGKAGVGLQTQVAKLSEKETTSTAQVSAIRSTGGSVSRTASNSIVDVGTELEAAENFTQSAKTIESFAARNESTSERSYEEVTAKVGVYVEAEGEAKAQAGAEANASAKGAGAEAGAEASAEGGARAGIEVQVDTLSERERQRSTEAVVSNIKVGGNFTSTSQQASTFEGTSVDAGGDVTVSGDSVNITAARNTNEEEFSSTTTSSRVAVAVGVGGSAKAGAKVSSDGEAEAGAEAEGGVKARVEVETSVATEDEKTTETEAVTASFRSGNNVNLQANNQVNIEGADIEAQNAINVEASELNFRAAANTSETTSSSTSVDVEVVVEATIIGSTGVEGEVGVDVETANAASRSSEAVTGSLSSSNLNIKTQGNANFEGTQVEATDSANLDIGGNLNVTAAANTASAEEDSTAVSVDVSASSDGEFGLEVGVDVGNAQERSSEAVVSSFNVGNLNVKTGGDANFEGAQIEASGDANLDIGGDLNVTAARNTASSESLDVSVEVGIGATDKKEDDGSTESGGSFKLGATVNVAKSDSNEAVTGLLGAGGKLNIKTGGDATFEGTDIAGGEGVDLEAGGNVAFNEAVSTESNLEVGVGVGIGVESSTEVDGDSGDSKKTDKQTLSADLALDISSSAQGKGSNISGGAGGINIKSGGDVTLQGTELDQDANIDAAGNVIETGLTSESSGFNMDFAVEVENETETETKGNKGDEKADGDKDADESNKDDADNVKKDGDEAGADNADDAKAKKADGGDDADDDAKAKKADGGDDADDDTKAKKADGGDDADKKDAKEADAEEEESEAPEIDMFEEDDKGDEGEDAAADEDQASEDEGSPPQALTLRNGRVRVPGLRTLGSTADVELTDADGNALPDWVSLNAATGELVVDVPSDFSGSLDVNIQLPGGDSFSVTVE